MIIKKEGLTYKGTRIMVGEDAKYKRYKLNQCIETLEKRGFEEIMMPIIQFGETFKGKVGSENNNLMFTFKDRADRNLALPPEYTAIVQQLAKTTFKQDKDVKLFYIGECFRGENPQFGRYRQFTQLGVEILNPSSDNTTYLIKLAKTLMACFYCPGSVEDFLKISESITLNKEATRGLDYYVDPTTKLPLGKGFEMNSSLLGTASQVCGGGTYDGGQGFALGIDRLLLLKEKTNEILSTP